MVIQEEQLGVRPDIAAVVCHEDRHVAHHPHPAGIGRVLQGQPLPEEQELQGLLAGHRLRQALAPVHQRLRRAAGDVRLPGMPRRALMCLFERHEEGEVVQPGGMPGSKRCKGLGERTMGAQREALRRPGEELALEGYDDAKRDLLRRERRDVTHLLRREQPVGDQ
jgi:hypothetical protein